MNNKTCTVCDKRLSGRTKSGLCWVHYRTSPDNIKRLNQASREGAEVRRPRPHPQEDAIIANVSRDMGVHQRDIIGHYRYPFVVDARVVCVMLMHRVGMSYSAIGRRMDRDHTTISYLVRGFGERAKRKPLLAATVERLAA